MTHYIRKTNSTGSLYRLIYCSRNTIASAAPDSDAGEQLLAIVAAARRNNKANNVTGALLATASGFAQALEGTRDIVERTFERISADPRHDDVTILSFTPTERRSFPDWPMGFSGQTDGGLPDPLAHVLADATSSGPRATTGSDVLRLLERVVQQEDVGVSA